VRSDDRGRARAQCDRRECALSSGFADVALDAPVERGDDHVSAPAGLSDGGCDARRRSPGGTGVPAERPELEREDRGEADERDAQAKAADDPRAVGRPLVGAGADRHDPGVPHVAQGVEQSGVAVVTGVVVGERHDIDAAAPPHRADRAGSPAEHELLVLRGSTQADRALQVGERDVGPRGQRTDARPGVVGPEARDHRSRPVAEVHVADRRQQQRPHPDATRRGQAAVGAARSDAQQLRMGRCAQQPWDPGPDDRAADRPPASTIEQLELGGERQPADPDGQAAARRNRARRVNGGTDLRLVPALARNGRARGRERDDQGDGHSSSPPAGATALRDGRTRSHGSS
jgi:hypothetical protein